MPRYRIQELDQEGDVILTTYLRASSLPGAQKIYENKVAFEIKWEEPNKDGTACDGEYEVFDPDDAEPILIGLLLTEIEER